MYGKIPEKLIKAIGGEDTIKHYGLTTRDLSWKKYVTINLADLTKERLARLAEMIAPHSKLRGAASLLRDIRTVERMHAGDVGAVKPRSVEHAATILRAFLEVVPGHRVYQQDKQNDDVWFPYYVESISFQPEYMNRDDRVPARVHVDLMWIEMGKRKETRETFYASDVLGLIPSEILKGKGYVCETPRFRARYLRDLRRYEDLFGKVGLQVLGRGVGTDNLDGNEHVKGYTKYSRNTLRLDPNDQPAKMLIDVVQEGDGVDRDRDANVDIYFWRRKTLKVSTDEISDAEDDSYDDLDGEDEDDAEPKIDKRKDLEADDEVEERPEIEIPTHPIIPTFDLRRHIRLRVHVACLEVYKYDTELRSKLVLPRDVIDLIEMLISRRESFNDIVAGKSGGTVVLCAGPAGVGKTLTAEVYSESTERPLYSVQCSQLGMKPAELEENLVRVFARAQRWNAILQLDEADVYVMSRGRDLIQNAIVGVFLRTLEYYSGTLFMTTNRADQVDDAIASRCVARIDYQIPTAEEQRRIWRVLADTSGIEIAPEVIDAFVEKHKISGRDVKNLLKLSNMISTSRGEPITLATIEFAQRFKPTGSDKENAHA